MLTWAAVLLASLSTARQFRYSLFPFQLLSLSEACFNAVKTTVPSCPSWLRGHTGITRAGFRILENPQLEDLCESPCLDELTSLRATIARACTAETDVMVPENIAYPATFLVDRFLYAVKLSCLKDPTGQYCDAVLRSWQNQTEYTHAQNCSWCELELHRMQLASPFGYNEYAASEFASITSSCQATQYGYAAPTRYALNSTTFELAKPTCTAGTYVVKEGDACNSIAGANSVATEALISANWFDIFCNNFPPPGTTICLPRACKIRQLAMDDTCNSITKAENITRAQLLAWNPVISAGCRNLHSWRGRYICVSSPTETIDVPEGNVATTAAPLLTNTQGGSNKYCGQWYTVQKGDTCASISVSFGIPLSDFYFLNLQVDSSCTNLWLGYAYCVKPVGNIETYPGYPVTAPCTSFARPPVSTETSTTQPVAATPPARAPGTIDGCSLYDWGYPEEVTLLDPMMNWCGSWARYAEVRVEDLIAWNPSLDANNCFLKTEYSYCIRRDGRSSSNPPSTSIATSTTPSQPTSTMPGVKPPAPTQPGAIAKCAKWHTVVEGDDCWAIANKYGISLADFYLWNPGVGSDCSSLWLGYAVCVGV